MKQSVEEKLKNDIKDEMAKVLMAFCGDDEQGYVGCRKWLGKVMKEVGIKGNLPTVKEWKKSKMREELKKEEQ